MSSVKGHLTDGQSVYMALRSMLFSDRASDQLLATLGSDEPLLEEAIAELLAGHPASARSKLEDTGNCGHLEGYWGYWVALAKARQVDGDLEGARDALRQLFKIERLETRVELQAWTLLRELGVQPDRGIADRVLGVVVDMGMERGAATVAGYADGDARIFWSSGGGVIGDLRICPRVSQAAKRLVDSAQGVVHSWPFDGSHALPDAGRVRFALLTPAGIRATDEQEKDVQRDQHGLYPVYLAMHGLITSLRLVYEGQS